ncbi:MAG: hypothetical protein Q8L21_02445, partial [Candidatus Komeilibacteria bacterium]|nr:hypothetical protein [Candidatus Komeilibacteria bacterium]
IFNSIYSYSLDVWRELMGARNAAESGLIMFFNGGWLILLLAFWSSGLNSWINWRRNLYHSKTRRFILLAIDVPRDNEQSPLAVENIFSHLYGILPGKNTKWQTWWLGKTTDYFSVEIVSIDGYVQFLIYAMEDYRDLVESAFYAQYPDAEITEVEDYVDGPSGEFKNLTFPNDKYDIFGTEFALGKDNAYPIRLWKEFEHVMSQEFKDPMASLLENMNKIGPGEQIWLQWVLTPEYNRNWQPQAQAMAMKIAGKSGTEKQAGLLDIILDNSLKWLDAIGSVIFPFYNASEGEEQKKKDDLPSLMLHLTPTERSQLEGIQLKADKSAFWTKFRYIYIAKKEVFSKARGVATVLGSLTQFNSLNNNGFGPHRFTKTSGIDYWLVNWRMSLRKNKILRAIQGRSRAMGSHGIILNTEELATVYHFPVITVKAPLVSRTESKRASAPISLPLEGALPFDRFHSRGAAHTAAPPAALPASEAVPDNLPFIDN